MKVNKAVLAVVVGLAGMAYAADMDVKAELAALKAQLSAQQSRIAAQDSQIAQLKGETWLTERRAEEVKALVRDVLADAETRASLLDSGMTAGYMAGEGFYLASDDGNFRLNINGQMQIRYVLNHSDQAKAATGGVAETNDGFYLPRVKLAFSGHMFDPKLTYAISGNFNGIGGFGNAAINNVEDGDFELENAWVAYEVADGWTVKGGQFKAPFLREEAVDSSMQLAVERSTAANFFTVDYTQGVAVCYAGEVEGTPIRAALMMHDGSFGGNMQETPAVLGQDLYDFAVSARAEVLLAGSWDQFDDFATWSGSDMALMVGAAFDTEIAGNRVGPASVPDVRKWTVDVSYEQPDFYGLNVFFAYMGMDTAENDALALSPNDNPWAIVLQAGAFVVPDKVDVFMRYEFIDADPNLTVFAVPPVDDEISIITIGTNYYIKKHAAKASLDVVWALDATSSSPMAGGAFLPGNAAVTQSGLVNSTDDQVAVRAQFQLLF